MPLTNWSPKEFTQLIRLFDLSRGQHSSFDGQITFGIVARDLKQYLRDLDHKKFASWLVHTGFTNTICEHTDDDSVFVDVEESGEDGIVFYRDPMTFRKQIIPISEVAVYKIDEFKFLHLMADQFDVPKLGRDGISNPAVPDILWRLGEGRLDHGFKKDIWIIRDMRANWDSLVSVLTHTGQSGVILCSTPCEPKYWPVIDGFNLINLKDLILGVEDTAFIDSNQLYDLVLGNTNSIVNSVLPVDYDPHQRKLTIVGKDPWFIKGSKQAKAVEYMVGQAKRNRWELPVNEILSAANEGRMGTKRLSSLFGVVSPWQHYIVNKKRGYYGFNL